MDKLVAGKETVIVVGYLYGFPIPGTPKKMSTTLVRLIWVK